MKITLEVSDDLYRRAKSEAALRGSNVDKVASGSYQGLCVQSV